MKQISILTSAISIVESVAKYLYINVRRMYTPRSMEWCTCCGSSLNGETSYIDKLSLSYYEVHLVDPRIKPTFNPTVEFAARLS